MKIFCTAFLFILFFSCSPTWKAAKEDKKRLNNIQLLQNVRLIYPCTVDTIIRGITRYLPGDTLYSKEQKIIIQPIERIDTIIQIDLAHVELLRDSIGHLIYIDDLKNDEIKALQKDLLKAKKGRDMWRNIAIPSLSLLAIMILLKIKRII